MENQIFFLIKKAISPFIIPSKIILILFIISFILSLQRKKWSLHILTFSVALLFLFLFSFLPFITVLLRPLTTEFNKDNNRLTHDKIETVVVLLGGVNYDYRDNNHELSPLSKIRVIKAIELAQDEKIKRIILSGGCGKPLGNCPITEAEVALKFMEKFIKDKEIILENISKDTFTNLINVKKIVGDKPFYLVTSPFHLKRALIISKELGLKAYPVPSHKMRDSAHDLWDYLPSSENLYLSDMVIHEYYGILLHKLMGKK